MSDIDMKGVDVIVVGAGNAAACAALSAVEHGAKVLMLETAPKESRGGNSAFTGFLAVSAGWQIAISLLSSTLSRPWSCASQLCVATDFGMRGL